MTLEIHLKTPQPRRINLHPEAARIVLKCLLQLTQDGTIRWPDGPPSFSYGQFSNGRWREDINEGGLTLEQQCLEEIEQEEHQHLKCLIKRSQMSFVGEVKGATRRVYVEDPEGQQFELDLRLDLCNHSPTGPSWGYHGSGPAQLALGMLVFARNDTHFALDHYQLFKARVVAGFNQDQNWRLSVAEVQSWVP